MKYLAAVFALLTWAAEAGAGPVLAVHVTGPGAQLQERFAAPLREALPATIALVDQPEKAEVLVALGDEAFRRALAGDRPVIGLRLAPAVLAAARANDCACSAILGHASALDQLDLIHALIPAARRVGLLHRGNIPDLAMLDRRAAELGLLLVASEMQGRRPAVALAELMPRVDVLLALPDRELYNPVNARVILMTSYRQNRPVIGPDENWVKAGSLASAWVDESAQLEALVEMLEQYRESRRLPSPVRPPVRSVLNPHVAEAFQVPVPADDRVEQLEVAP